jgi:Mn2+/Fe2+ NRAMP family transporter
MIMSNETTQKRSLSVSLGAAFLMATSAIGPGFLTQTSQFTAKYLSSFAFVIVCVIIMDMIAQTNVWSIVGVSGLRGQEIANKVLPGLGYLLVVLVVLGGLAFNIGNVGGVSLGFNAMIGIPEKAGVIIGGVLAICIFLSKKANDIVGRVAQILGGIIIVVMLVVAFMAKPPVGDAVAHLVGLDQLFARCVHHRVERAEVACKVFGRRLAHETDAQREEHPREGHLR